MADTPVCDWEKCRRHERPTKAIAGDVITLSAMAHPVIGGGHWLKRRLAQLGFELAGVCEQCALLLVELAVPEGVPRTCGHRRRTMAEVLRSLNETAERLQRRNLELTVNERQVLRACLMQFSWELHGCCLSCACVVVAESERGGRGGDA